MKFKDIMIPSSVWYVYYCSGSAICHVFARESKLKKMYSYSGI